MSAPFLEGIPDIRLAIERKLSPGGALVQLRVGGSRRQKAEDGTGGSHEVAPGRFRVLHLDERTGGGPDDPGILRNLVLQLPRTPARVPEESSQSGLPLGVDFQFPGAVRRKGPEGDRGRALQPLQADDSQVAGGNRPALEEGNAAEDSVGVALGKFAQRFLDRAVEDNTESSFVRAVLGEVQDGPTKIGSEQSRVGKKQRTGEVFGAG